MSNLLVSNLKKLFSGQEYGLILRAMRYDPVVWSTFDDPVITNQMVDLAGSDISRWTPAFLALTVLGIPGKYNLLRTQSGSIDEKLKYRAAGELERITTSKLQETADLSIELAGLASLAVRERWMILHQIDIKLFEDISNQVIWNTTAACLAGLLAEPGQFFQNLLLSHQPQLQSLALHAASTNPLLEDELIKQFLSTAKQLPTIERIEFLRKCSQSNQKLAQSLATNLIERAADVGKTTTNPFDVIQEFAEMSELFRITGQYEQAIPALEKLWRATSSLQTDLASQLAQAAAKADHQDAAIMAIEKISQLENSLQPDDRASIALAQIHTGQLDPKILENSKGADLPPHANPATLVAKAQVALNDADFPKAQRYAMQAYEVSAKSLQSKNSRSGVFSTGFNPDFIQTLIELLIELELVIEAGNLCDLSLDKLPNNDEIVFLASRAAYLAGDISQALEHAQVAVALSPDHIPYRKRLVDLLVRQNNWTEALHEVHTYISQEKTPTAEDFLLLSTCLLKSDQTKDALIAARKSLERDPENDQIHAQLGEIYRLTKNPNEAIKHFNQAIILQPQNASYWSTLAAIYQIEGNTEKAEEILNSAFEVIPHNSQLHLQLGDIHIQGNKPEPALAEFQKAKQFLSSETDNAIRKSVCKKLGKTLQDQGYCQEALTVLEEAHQAFPVEPEIAHLYANVLFRNGQTHEALSAYQIAGQTPASSAELLLDHSQALLSIGDKTGEARAKIERALGLEPDNPIGKALLAEATAQSGEHTEAIKLYQQALQTEIAEQEYWRVKLSTNLADSAFALNQPEIAITILQEALDNVPKSLPVKQALCDAFIRTELTQDARRLINEILEQHSQNLDTLMWAADQAIIINDLEFAAEILNQARQISPHKADILVRLGYIQLENGNEQLARKTFGQLFSAENVDIKNLRLAAQALIGLGDITSSIPYLEKALELSDYKSGDLLNELTKLHLKSGNLQAALGTVQKQIKIQPMLPKLHVTQADIYSQLSQPKAALNSMLKALELAPSSAPLQAKTANLLRKNQDLPGSLYHITQAFEIDPSDPKISIQAAQIFSACLLEEKALKICEQIADMDNPPLAAALLAADLFLDHPTDERLQQASRLTEFAGELASSHPRLLAILSRMTLNQGEVSKAERLLEQAMLNLSEYDAEELDNIALATIKLTIAKAALVLRRWDMALFFSREAQQLSPHEPYPFYLQTRIYTQRAETHHRDSAILKSCLTTKKVATHKVSQNAFISALRSAEAYSPDPNANQTLAPWRARGELALRNASPTDYHAGLRDHPDNFSAVLAAVSRADQVPDFDITLFHDEPAVIFERALLNSRQDPQNGLALAEKLVQLEPNNPDFAALYAIMAEKAGQIKLALNSIEIALSMCPQEPHWHSLAAKLHLALGGPDLAIAHLEKALEIEKNNPEHLFMLGKAYLANHSPGNAIQILEQAAKLNPLEPEYWIALAKSYTMAGNSAYALDAAKQALKLSPNNLKYLLAGAHTANQAEDRQLSTKLITKAMSLPTQSIDEIVQISDLLISLEQLEQARDYLEEKIELAMNQVPLLIQQAKLVGLIEGSKQKMDLLIQLAKENSKNPLIFAHLAEGYIQTKNPEEAIRAAQFALKYADDRLTENDRIKLHFQLGVLLKQSGQLDQALHQLTESLELSPNFLEARLEIGETLCQRKEYVQALEHFQKAIEIAPQDPRPYKQAGLLLKESKDYVAAEAMFRQAYALDSNDISIQRQLATVIALALIHQPNINRFSHGKSKQS